MLTIVKKLEDSIYKKDIINQKYNFLGEYVGVKNVGLLIIGTKYIPVSSIIVCQRTRVIVSFVIFLNRSMVVKVEAKIFLLKDLLIRKRL